MAAGLFAAMAVPGVFLTRGVAEGLVEAGLLAALLAVPVLSGIERVHDVRSHRYVLLVAGTLAWDVLTATLGGRRATFSEWPLVYGSGLLAFALIYVLQAALTGRLVRRRRDAAAVSGLQPRG